MGEAAKVISVFLSLLLRVSFTFEYLLRGPYIEITYV